MVEVMDHANACLTWRERYVLVAIADNLRDNTRCGWPAFDGEDQYAERFRLRTCCSRTQFYEALQGLTDMGVVKILEAGHNGRRAEYYIPPLAALVLQPRRPKKKSTKSSVQETGTLQGVGQGVPEGYREPLPEPPDSGNRDTTAGVVSRFDGSSVRETGTPTPQVSSGTASLNNANAAGAGWGVWGEGAISRPGDEPAAVAAVVADAPPGDGLRPRDYVAPDTDASPDRPDEEPQPQLDGDEKRRSDESMAHALADLDEATYVRLKRETKDRLGPDGQCRWVSVMYEFAVGSGLIGRPA